MKQIIKNRAGKVVAIIEEGNDQKWVKDAGGRPLAVYMKGINQTNTVGGKFVGQGDYTMTFVNMLTD